MCGIAGIVRAGGGPVDRELLARMTERLRHRGPDADGLFLDGNLGLGHRRLSVIDPSSAANQPMQDPELGLTLVYNGEIYNFRELREELLAAGHRFQTRSDSEVLLRGWQAFGARLLPRLRGMFAFAIHDARQRKLFLARDRLGKKPLY